jgi:hypothetical protein
MRASGHAGTFHLATLSERRQLLRAKLVEEVREPFKKKSSWTFLYLLLTGGIEPYFARDGRCGS